MQPSHIPAGRARPKLSFAGGVEDGSGEAGGGGRLRRVGYGARPVGAGGGEGAARGGARGGRYSAADLSALRAVSVQGSFRASAAAGPGDGALEDEFPAPAPPQPGGEAMEVSAEGDAGGPAGQQLLVLSLPLRCLGQFRGQGRSAETTS